MTIDLVVSPEPRDPNKVPQRARFIAHLDVGGRVLGAFADPLCSCARLLLAEGVLPETALRLRHAGSTMVALTSTVGTAARLSVRETGDGKPRFGTWKPFGHSRLEVAA
jgi:hypothetical protein